VNPNPAKRREEHQPIYRIWVWERQFLRHRATHRKPEDVSPMKPAALDQPGGIASHEPAHADARLL
jgi:hypothetical protein